VLRAFTPRVVAALEPRIRELARALLDAVIERGEMDVATDFSIPLPLMVIAEMIGIPTADRPQFRHWSDVILDLAESVAGSADAPRAASAFAAATEEMRAYLSALVAERRAVPRDDLLGRLVAAEVDGERLADDDILGFFQLLLVAGSETTTNLIANMVVCLLDHPGERARLAATPGLLPSAIEEVLRYRTPVPAVFRQTTCDVGAPRAHHPGRKARPRGRRRGEPRPAPLRGAGPLRYRTRPEPARRVRARDPFLPRRGARAARGPYRARGVLRASAGVAPGADAPWEPRKAFHVHGPARLPIRFTPTRG
jgi:hypothetical protein